jgi:hypothetical protein
LFAVTTGLPSDQRLAHQVAGDADAADQLDDDVHRGVLDDRLGVAGQQRAIHGHAAVAVDVEVGDAAQHQPHAGARGQQVAVLLQAFHHPGADGAEAQQSQANFFHRALCSGAAPPSYKKTPHR